MTALRPQLRQKIVIGLVVYTLMLTIAVGLHGFIVNENIEKLVWQTVLNNEINYIKKRLINEDDHASELQEGLSWYDESHGDSIPDVFSYLTPGFHDEIALHDRLFVVLVEQNDNKKQILALDITEIEQHEFLVITSMIIMASIVITVMAYIGYWMLGRLLKPLFRIAQDISELPPDGSGKKIPVFTNDPQESVVIAEAINQYIDKIQSYTYREQQFINTASHELRTPIAVISGAAEVMLSHPRTSNELIPHLERVSRISREMEELLTLLLALAKDKDKLKNNAENINIAHELPRIIENHQYLCEGKELSIQSELIDVMIVKAPPQLLNVTISNLLRNAIENSDRGVIRIYAKDQSTLEIVDPGHGMTAQEMSKLYINTAKSGKKRAGGIGIDLILRICQHYGWQLSLESEPGKGTRAVLHLA